MENSYRLSIYLTETLEKKGEKTKRLMTFQ